eukprot:6644713-Pyramimonas_sp.AAC.1
MHEVLECKIAVLHLLPPALADQLPLFLMFMPEVVAKLQKVILVHNTNEVQAQGGSSAVGR